MKVLQLEAIQQKQFSHRLTDINKSVIPGVSLQDCNEDAEPNDITQGPAVSTERWGALILLHSAPRGAPEPSQVLREKPQSIPTANPKNALTALAWKVPSEDPGRVN